MKKRYYLSPRVTFTEVDQEGLICASPTIHVRVKDYDNINDYGEGVEAPEQFYFGS